MILLVLATAAAVAVCAYYGFGLTKPQKYDGEQ